MAADMFESIITGVLAGTATGVATFGILVKRYGIEIRSNDMATRSEDEPIEVDAIDVEAAANRWATDTGREHFAPFITQKVNLVNDITRQRDRARRSTKRRWTWPW